MTGTYNGFSGDQRNRAQAWLNVGWSTGRFPRPSRCRACGQTAGVLDAHAEDYSEPFGPHLLAFPMCFRCHMMVHCRFTSAPQFWRYVTALEQGVTFLPIFTRDFTAIKREHLWSAGLPPAGTPGDGAERDILRRIAAGEFVPHREPALTLFGF